MRKVIETEKAPGAIGPYSQAIAADAFVYTSGQLPIDMQTGDLVLDDIQRATRCALENVQSILAAAGLTMADVVKTTVFLTDLADFAAMNETYAAFFPDAPPARSCVQVAALPKDARVEIEAVAVKRG